MRFGFKVYKIDDATVIRRFTECAPTVVGADVAYSAGDNQRNYTARGNELDPDSQETFFLNGQSVFEVIKAYRSEEHKLIYLRQRSSPFDLVEFHHPTSDGQGRTVAQLTKIVGEKFRVVPPELELELLTEGPIKEAVNANLAQIGRLQELMTTTAESLRQERIKNEIDLKRERDKLAKDHEAKLKEVQDLARLNVETNENAQKALAEKEAKLDLKSNTAARRQLHSDQQKDATGFLKNANDVKAITREDLPVVSIFVVLLVCAAIVVITTTAAMTSSTGHTEAESSSPTFYYLILKNLIASVTFVVVGFSLIRWIDRRYKDRSDGIRRAEKVAIDTKRSNWLVESAFEWQLEKAGPFPELMIERLSANLFGPTDAPREPQKVGAPNLSGLSVKAPGVEVQFANDEKSKEKRG